ncbi:hypothetical protein P3T36_002983 [Kitasatospora sp. MAP12-15]|nr:hypothetical protein [Kitasatospora sp. MAP12-44]
MFEAVARRLNGPGGFSKPAATADEGAGLLLIMLRADGWTGNESALLEQLAAGEPVIHGNFEYQVTGVSSID